MNCEVIIHQWIDKYLAKFKKGHFIIYNGHLVKIKVYIRTDYVQGDDERGNTVTL